MTVSTANSLRPEKPDTIPEGWQEVPVQKLIEKHFCGPSPDCEERQRRSDDEWGVLRTTAITWAGWNEAAHKVLPHRFWGLGHLQVQHGDVLITKAGPRDRVAVVVHVTTHPKRLVVSGKMIGLRPRKDAVVPQVLAGALGLRRSQEFIHGRTTGMAESQVNFANTVLLDTRVRVPMQLREQSRIAEILDTVDAAIRETEAVVAKLRQVKAGLLHDLLTRGLDAHGRLRDPARHPEQFQDSPLGPVPKAWNVRRLASLTSKIMDGAHVTPTYVENGVPFLRVTDIQGEGLDLKDVKRIPMSEHRVLTKRTKPEQGDILYSKNGTIGLTKLVTWDWEFSIFVSLALIKPKATEMESAFLACVLPSFLVQKQICLRSKQMTVINLHLEEIREFLIPTPNLAEQSRIASCVAGFDESLRSYVVQLEKLRSFKSGLAHDLLTGRVRVNVGGGA